MAASEYGLSIVLDFQDRASSGIQKTLGLFQNLSGSVNNLTKNFGDTGDTLWGLNSSIVGMSVMGNQFEDMGKGMYSTLGKVANSVMETGSSFESFRITMGALHGSTEAADEEIEKLFNYATKSPYMVKDLQDVMVTFRSLGLDAFGDVTNASTGFSESLMSWMGDLQSFRPGEAMSRWKRGLQNFLSGSNTQSATVLRNILDVGDIATFVGHDLGKTVEERVQTLTDIVTKLNLQGVQDNLSATWGITISNMQDVWDKFTYDIGFGRKKSNMYTLAVNAAKNLLQIEQDLLGNKGVIEAVSKSFENLIKPLERATYIMTLFSPAISEWLGRHPELFTFAEGLTAISGAGLITTGILLKLSGSVLNWMNNVQRLGGLEAILRTISSASKLAFLNVLKFSSLPILGAFAYKDNWFGLKDFITDSGGQIGSLIEKLSISMRGNEEEGKKPMSFREALDDNGLKTFRRGLDDLSSSMKNLTASFYEGIRGFFKFFGVDLPIYTKDTFNLTKVLNDLGKTLSEKFGGKAFEDFSKKHGGLIKTLGGITAGLMTAFAASSLLKVGMLILKTTVVDTISTFGMLMQTLATPAGMLGLGMAGLYAGYQYNFLGLHDSLQKPITEIMQARDLLIEMSSGYGKKSKALVEEYGLRDFAEGLLGVKDTLKTLKSEFLNGFLGAGGSFGGLFGSLISILIGGGSVTDALNSFGNALRKIHENTAFNGILSKAANLLGTIASAATTAGGSLILIGGLVGTVFVPLISSLGTIGSLMFSALVSPFGLATMALTAYATNFGGLKDKVDGFLGLYADIRESYRTFKEEGTVVGKKVSEEDFLSGWGYGREQYEFLGDNWVSFGDVNNIFDLLDSKKTIFKAFTDGLKDGLSSVFNSVKSLVSALLGIPDVPLLDWVKKLNSYLGELGISKITDKASDLGKTVGELVGKIGLLLPLVGVVGKLGTTMERTFGVKVSPLTTGLKLVNDGFKMITSGASEMKNAVVSAFKTVASTVKGFYSTLLGRGATGITNFFKNLGGNLIFGAEGNFMRTLGYTGNNFGGLFGMGGGNGAALGNAQGGFFSLFPTTTAGFAHGLNRLSHFTRPVSDRRNILGLAMDSLYPKLANYINNYLPRPLWDNEHNFLGYGAPRRDMVSDIRNGLSRHSLDSWLTHTPYTISERFKNSYLGRSIEAARTYNIPSVLSSRTMSSAFSKTSDLGSFLATYEGRYNNILNSMRAGTPAQEIAYLNNKRRKYTQTLISKLEGTRLASQYTSIRNGRRVINADQLRSLYSDFYAYNSPSGGKYGKLNSLSKFLVNPEGRTKAFMRLMRMKVSQGGISALFPNLLSGLNSFATGVATYAPQIVAGYSRIVFGIQMLKMQTGVQVFTSLVSSLGQLALSTTKIALGFTKMSVGLSLISLGVMTFGTMATSEWKGLTDAIKEQETPLGKIRAAYEWFTGHLSSNISKLTEKMANFDVSGFVQKIMGVAGTLGDTILALVGGSNGDNGMAEILASTFDGLLSGINEGSKVSGKLFNVLSGVFNSSMQSLRNHAPSIGASIRGILFNALNFAAANIDSLVATVGDLLVNLFDVQDPEKTATLGVKIINSILNGIITYAPQIIDGADEVVSTFLKQLNNPVTRDKLVMSGRTLIYHLGNSIKDNGQLLWDLAVPVFKGLWKDIVATFADGIADCMFKVATFSGWLGGILTVIGAITQNPLVLGTGIALDTLALGMGVGGFVVKGYGAQAKEDVEKSLYGGHSSRLATLEELFTGRSPSESSEFYPGYSSHIEGAQEVPPNTKSLSDAVKENKPFYVDKEGMYSGSFAFIPDDSETFQKFLKDESALKYGGLVDRYTTNKDGLVKKQSGRIIAMEEGRTLTHTDEFGEHYNVNEKYYWIPGTNTHMPTEEELKKNKNIELLGEGVSVVIKEVDVSSEAKEDVQEQLNENPPTVSANAEITEESKQQATEEIANMGAQTDLTLNVTEEEKNKVTEAVNEATANATPTLTLDPEKVKNNFNLDELSKAFTVGGSEGAKNYMKTMEVPIPVTPKIEPEIPLNEAINNWLHNESVKSKDESKSDYLQRITDRATELDKEYGTSYFTKNVEVTVRALYNEEQFKTSCSEMWEGVKTLFNNWKAGIEAKKEEKTSDANAYFGVAVAVDHTLIEQSEKDITGLKNELNELPKEPTAVEVTDNETAKITTGNIVEVANALSNLRSNNKATVEITADTSSLKAAEETIDKFYNKYGFAKPGFNISNKSASSSEVKDGNAKGTNNWKGGLTWVHETGAEIIDLPSGTRIVPRARSLVEMYNRGLEDGFITTPTNDLDDVLFAPEPSAAQIIQSVTNVTTSPTQVIASKGGGTSQDSYDYSVHFESGSVVIHIDNPQSDLDYKKAAEKIMYYAAEKQRRMAMARR